jgi:hypothetical protein
MAEAETACWDMVWKLEGIALKLVTSTFSYCSTCYLFYRITSPLLSSRTGYLLFTLENGVYLAIGTGTHKNKVNRPPFYTVKCFFMKLRGKQNNGVTAIV